MACAVVGCLRLASNGDSFSRKNPAAEQDK